MVSIKHLIFDADDTLLDFGMALMRAQKAVADRIGIRIEEEYLLTDWELMYEAYHEFQMTETNDFEIQKYWHLHYRMCIVRHYELLMERFGIQLDPYELLRLTFESISEMHYTMEKETLDIFKALSETYKISIATNCVTEIKGRLSVFEPYCYKIFISEEIQAIKPTSAFYHAVLDGLDCQPEECLMIGDSAKDDMAGGKAAGLHTCWYHRGKSGEVCPYADYSIDSITELPELLNR